MQELGTSATAQTTRANKQSKEYLDSEINNYKSCLRDKDFEIIRKITSPNKAYLSQE